MTMSILSAVFIWLVLLIISLGGTVGDAFFTEVGEYEKVPPSFLVGDKGG